jgi:hypothetical protein
MAVGIYTSTTPDSLLSQDGFFTNPFAITFDGRLGGFKEKRLYLRNADAAFYYTDLTLSLVDSSATPIINREGDGFVWKLKAGSIKPTLNDWKNTASNNTITFSNLGELGFPDTSTYLPFWVYIQVPAELDIQTFTTVKFVLDGDEVLV